MDVYAQLITFGAAAAAEKLLISTCGNASLRLDDETMLISGTGSELRQLAADQISRVRLADGAHLSGPKPSMEVDLHRLVYLARPGAGAVLHCQSPGATLLACHADPPQDLNFIPEIPVYVGRPVYVEYAAPGSDRLAGHVADAFADPEVNVVQMRNHGQTYAGKSWRALIRSAVFFEFACWMALQGTALRTIPATDVATLRDYGRER